MTYLKKNKERHSFAIRCHYLVISRYVVLAEHAIAETGFFPLRDCPFQSQTIAFETETERARRGSWTRTRTRLSLSTQLVLRIQSILNLPSALHESLRPILLCHLERETQGKAECAKEEADCEQRERCLSVEVSGRWRSYWVRKQSPFELTHHQVLVSTLLCGTLSWCQERRQVKSLVLRSMTPVKKSTTTQIQHWVLNNDTFYVRKGRAENVQGRNPVGVRKTEGKWGVSEQAVGRGRRTRVRLDHPLKCLSMVGHFGVLCAPYLSQDRCKLSSQPSFSHRVSDPRTYSQSVLTPLPVINDRSMQSDQKQFHS